MIPHCCQYFSSPLENKTPHLLVILLSPQWCSGLWSFRLLDRSLFLKMMKLHLSSLVSLYVPHNSNPVLALQTQRSSLLLVVLVSVYMVSQKLQTPQCPQFVCELLSVIRIHV